MLRLFAYLMTDTLLFSDDFTGAVNNGWSANWAANNVGGGAVNLDGSGHGRISATVAGAASKAQAIVTDGDDFDFRVAINRSGSSTTGFKFFIAPVADNPTAASNNFPFNNAVWGEATLTTSPNMTFKAARNGVVTTGPVLNLDLFATGVYQAIRLRKEGNILYYKKWQDGTGEPSNWNGTWDMSTNAPVGGGGTRRPFIGVTSSVTTSNLLLVDNVTATSITQPAVDAGYTAQPMTSTALAVDPVVTAQKIIHRTVNATVSTATGLFVDPTVQTVKADKTTTVTNLNANYMADSDSNVYVNPTVSAVGSSAERAVFSKASLGLPSDAKIGTAYFNFHVNIMTDPSMTLRVQSVDGPYDPNTLNGINKPAMGAIQTAFQTFNSNGQTGSYEVGAIVKAIQAGTAYGLALVGNSTGRGTIDTHGANPPTLTINYESSGLAQVVVVPLTGSGLFVDPTFSNKTNAAYAVQAMTGTALALDPSIYVKRDANIAAPIFDVYAEGPLGGFSVPLTFVASPATASGAALDASVTAQLNAVVRVTASESSAYLMPPVEAQNALDDPYYNRMYATTDSGDFWYRLDEVAGSVVNELRNPDKNADLFGDYSFGVYGPEGRRSMHFNNGYFKRKYAQENYTGVQGLSPYDDSDTSTFTFETVIRTTDGNGLLAYGIDRANPMNELGFISLFRNSIYLKDGKVSINWNYQSRTDSVFEFTGNKNIADGQWHHVVVSFVNGNEFDLNSGLRIYIDGKLDIRRRASVAPGIFASPDSYFGMPDAWRNESILYPWRKNFVGDVMEVAFRKDASLSQDQTIDLYYDAMGIKPIRVTPATGTGVMPDAKAKGNRLRALVLYTKWNGSGLSNPASAGEERTSPSGLDFNIPDEFDHSIQIGKVYEPGESPWEELASFRVVPISIMREDSHLDGPYRDPVTDLPRLLNLQEDLDLDEYDVILFRNWPDEGADLEKFRAGGYTNTDIENFLASVKKAVVDGLSLEVTNPNLAYRLGLISGAKAIPMLRNRKGYGESDGRAAVINPWDREKKLDSQYLDFHANNWHRIVSNIEGLTNGTGETKYEHITDVIMTYNYGTDGKINNKWAYKLSSEPLKIGEEIIDVVEFYNRLRTYLQDYTNAGILMWDKYVWSVTPDGLTVGTPLYKFNSKMWDGNTLVDNPYRDYIGGAVVQPGDVWGGQQVAGKVFMNFAESPWDAAYTTTLTRQIVPPNSEMTHPEIDAETDEMREWDYSGFNRVQYSSGTVTPNLTGIGQTQKVELRQDKSGKFYTVEVQSTKDTGTALPTLDIIEKWPIEYALVPNWFIKGMAWLASKEEVPNGSKVIRTTAAAATGSMPEPTVRVEKSNVVNAEAAISNGRMVSPVEVDEPDVTIYAFPATARGSMPQYEKTIHVAPFEATGELVDNFDLISAAGEQVVVYLHYVDAEVYLKEETR